MTDGANAPTAKKFSEQNTKFGAKEKERKSYLHFFWLSTNE